MSKKEAIKGAFKKLGAGAKSAAKAGYSFSQRIEYAPEDKIQRGERLFGLRGDTKPTKTTKGKTTKRKTTKKKPVKKAPAKRKPSRAPKASPPRQIKKPDAYVIVKKKRNPTVKKFSVQYKRGDNSKYKREWFDKYKDAEMFGKSIAKEYGVRVTYQNTD